VGQIINPNSLNTNSINSVSALTTRRQKNINNFLNSPVIIAPAWAPVTPYAVNNVVSLPSGLHIICSAAGNSAAGTPTYTSAVLDGRPLVDGTVTWYALPWIKTSNTLGAPTITSGANAAAVGLTETLFGNAGAIIQGPTAFSCQMVNFANAYLGTYGFASGPASGAGNATGNAIAAGLSAANVYSTNNWEIELYITDAAFGLTFHVSSNLTCVEIDGVIVQGNPVQQSGASGWCLKFDFNGVVKRRLVRVFDLFAQTLLRGVALTTIGFIEPSDSPNDQILALGDSMFNTGIPTVGSAIEQPLGAYLIKLLGISGVINCAVGGSGYVNQNANTYNVPAVLANAANQQLLGIYQPPHVLFYAGFNDRALPFTTVGPAALASWQLARQLLPKAKITITDGFSQASGPDANALTQAANLKALFTSWNDSNSRFVQSIGPSASTAWIQGTGNAGIALSVGNASNFVSTDGVHPTPSGEFYEASRMASAINAAWNGAY